MAEGGDTATSERHMVPVIIGQGAGLGASSSPSCAAAWRLWMSTSAASAFIAELQGISWAAPPESDIDAVAANAVANGVRKSVLTTAHTSSARVVRPKGRRGLRNLARRVAAYIRVRDRTLCSSREAVSLRY